VLGLTLLTLIVALPFLTAGQTPRDPEVASSTAETQEMDETALRRALDAAEQRLRDLRAAGEHAESVAAANAATAAENAATAAEEITRLRDQVKEAEARAAAEKEAADRAARRIQALTECLNGTTVALQFARSDAWDPADRALAAVSAACADARALR